MATKEELAIATTCSKHGFLDLESLWTFLSPKVKQALADEHFVKDITTSVSELDIAIAKLSVFSKLSLAERTCILDKYFQEYQSSDVYEHNLFSFRLGEKNAIHMIGLMCHSNWNAWICLLNALPQAE